MDDIKEHKVERLEKLLTLAPELQRRMKRYLAGNNVTAPSWEDYMGYDEDPELSLAFILQEAILEIELTVCNDFNSAAYLIYQPVYPWNLPDGDRNLTENSLREVFSRYVAVLTDELVSVDYQSVENGG